MAKRFSLKNGLAGAPGSIAFGLVLIAALGSCQMSNEPAGGYPSLGSVPQTSRPSLPVEERRQIVRDLIDERDRSREHTAVIRQRSGLSAAPPVSSVEEASQAEDIIPDLPKSGDAKGGLISDEDDNAISSYSSNDNQVEDGGLDDFIRQLKRDTSPPAPFPERPKEPTAGEGEGDETSFLPSENAGFSRLEAMVVTGTVRLAGFVPVITSRALVQPDRRLHFAAEEEPGFFCGWLGWTVGWSSLCVEGEEASEIEDGDDGVSADLQEDERRLSKEDAARAVENAGRGVLAPVTGSLEKLRNFFQSRRLAHQNSRSSQEQAPSLGEIERSAETAPIIRPPIPKGRPERRENITIVDRSERFDFNRTPTPAFKPRPDEPVILPPIQSSRPVRKTYAQLSSPAIPRARPRDHDRPTIKKEAKIAAATPPVVALQALAAEPTEPSESVDNPIPSRPNLKTAMPSIDAATKPYSVIIPFSPGKQDLPEKTMSRLAALLEDAKERDLKIYIFGEAGTNNLAYRRATQIGAALVRLSATAEILEYDFNIVADADRVRLVLKPKMPEARITTAIPTEFGQ